MRMRINELESTTDLFSKIRWRNGNQISVGSTNLRMIIVALVLKRGIENQNSIS